MEPRAKRWRRSPGFCKIPRLIALHRPPPPHVPMSRHSGVVLGRRSGGRLRERGGRQEGFAPPRGPSHSPRTPHPRLPSFRGLPSRGRRSRQRLGARSPTTRRRHGRCRRDPAEGRPDGPRPPKNPEGQRCSPPAETGGLRGAPHCRAGWGCPRQSLGVGSSQWSQRVPADPGGEASRKRER